MRLNLAWGVIILSRSHCQLHGSGIPLHSDGRFVHLLKVFLLVLLSCARFASCYLHQLLLSFPHQAEIHCCGQVPQEILPHALTPSRLLDTSLMYCGSRDSGEIVVSRLKGCMSTQIQQLPTNRFSFPSFSSISGCCYARVLARTPHLRSLFRKIYCQEAC